MKLGNECVWMVSTLLWVYIMSYKDTYEHCFRVLKWLYLNTVLILEKYFSEWAEGIRNAQCCFLCVVFYAVTNGDFDGVL